MNQIGARSLLDEILESRRLSAVFQPIFDVGDGPPRLFALECLIRGPKGARAETPFQLFDYVRRKHEDSATDRACLATLLAEAAGLPPVVPLCLNVLGRPLRGEGPA